MVFGVVAFLPAFDLATPAVQDGRVHIQGDGVQSQFVKQPAVAAGLNPGSDWLVKTLNNLTMALCPAAWLQSNRRTSVASKRVMSAWAKRAAPHQMLTIICSMSCSGRYPRLEPGWGNCQLCIASCKPMPSSMRFNSARPP